MTSLYFSGQRPAMQSYCACISSSSSIISSHTFMRYMVDAMPLISCVRDAPAEDIIAASRGLGFTFISPSEVSVL